VPLRPMPRKFFDLRVEDRREALELAGSRSGRPVALLEKDAWVVWTLEHLFNGPDAHTLVFKGGTSLSKAHHAIARFSEDIDLTYDIRALLGERVESGMPVSRSQAQKWTHAVREKLPVWIGTSVIPRLDAALKAASLNEVSVEHDGESVSLSYRPVAEIAYVKPIVKIEFGARSTGEPSMQLLVVCDAEQHLTAEGIAFPRTTPRAMAAERTFWEKATAMHAFCILGKFRGGDRFARHWYDVAKLDEAGYVDSAIADNSVGEDVALHKTYFFREPGVDYKAAISGSLRIVPKGDAAILLERDYSLMVESGMFTAVEPESFDSVINRCGAVEAKTNKARALVA
jgi:hypothetical protein